MGQALDGNGRVLGEAVGPTKRDVLDALELSHPDAAEIRIMAAGRQADELMTKRDVRSPLRDKLDDIFKYHAPDADQQVAYEKLRQSAKDFAHAIVDLTPACADQTAAVRLVREAVMTANAAIALRGLV